MPQQLEIPAIGWSSIKHKLKRRRQHASISRKTQHVPAEGLSRDMDIDLSLELLPAIEIPVVGGEQARPAVGGRHKRTNKADQAVVRLASKSIPWRSLPYLRVQALDDIRAIADIFGNDLGSLSPPAEWLDVGAARLSLSNLQDKQWWHKLGAQAILEPFTLDGQPLAVFLMEIFSGCGN